MHWLTTQQTSSFPHSKDTFLFTQIPPLHFVVSHHEESSDSQTMFLSHSPSFAAYSSKKHANVCVCV
jgi:hypothetical protein